ncbi:restriction endonuclease subunit S [Streptomyces niveus]
MSDVELPSGWAWARLGELGEYINGRGFKKSEWSDTGRPIIRIQNLTGSGEKFNHYAGDLDARHTVSPGDLLFSWAATLGVFIWRGPEAALNQHIFKVKPLIDKGFLRYLIDYKSQELMTATHGSGMVHVTRSKFDELTAAIPPLDEQRRIVEALEGHLSRIDVGTSSLMSLRTRTTRLRAVLYGKAVQGEFSKPMRADENVPLEVIEDASRSLSRRKWTPPDTVGLPGYVPPDHWTITSLGSLSHSSGYGTSTKCDYNAAGQAVLRIPNIQEGSIDLSDIKHSIDSTLDLSKYFLEPGDLLFVRTNGSRNLIGRVGVVEESLPVAFASYLIRFRLTPGFVEPRWVQLVTQSPLWRQIIERYAASSAGQYNLSAETLARLPIPIPSLEAQRQALETVDYFLASATRLSSAISASELRASRLRSSLLRTAFTGQLVPQDPADEPASVLLDRIRAERAAVPKPQRTRRPRKTATAAAPAPVPTPAPRTAIQQEFQL